VIFHFLTAVFSALGVCKPKTIKLPIKIKR